ncbi:MAG TPA: hemolysin family protein [Syntrophales bacterium]|nr:hemolysin family protein [Syntrophales bacterium]HOH72370.1 hemolysin family protein [Syntrophales bacterium]HPX82805.1 hemolysin family protein [Syntrophales bacterium]HQB13197.1 hemolysin family protein [Syntrophales bacterium]HQK79909.1 hemolysin family protein [Syntrophales bacterium]
MKLISLIKKIFQERDASRLEEEIQAIIDAGEEDGLIDPQSGEMIQSILEFKDTVVREVMVPRTEIVAVSAGATIEEIVRIISIYGHTRMPVYRGDIDHIIGVVNVKDLLKFWSREVTEKDFLSILRKPYYIPETKNISQLLHELKQKKYHLAIIIDEYGGTAGLVTLEDLMEEIIGEIHDEHDTQEPGIVEETDGYTLVDGRVEIEELEEYFGVTFDEGKYETLGGLILNTVKRIPAAGETIIVDNFEMTIVAADERRIKKVRIRKIRKEDEQNSPEA